MWYTKRMMRQGAVLVIVLSILWGCATRPRPETAAQAQAPMTPCAPSLSGHVRHRADAGRPRHEVHMEDEQHAACGMENASNPPCLQGDTSATGSPVPGEGIPQAATESKYRTVTDFGLNHFFYLMRLKRHIAQALFIPRFRPEHGPVGRPIVGLSMHRNGTLTEVVLLRSSGYAVLDCAVVEAVQRAAPYEPFPEHFSEQELRIRVYATVKEPANPKAF